MPDQSDRPDARFPEESFPEKPLWWFRKYGTAFRISNPPNVQIPISSIGRICRWCGMESSLCQVNPWSPFPRTKSFLQNRLSDERLVAWNFDPQLSVRWPSIRRWPHSSISLKAQALPFLLRLVQTSSYLQNNACSGNRSEGTAIRG